MSWSAILVSIIAAIFAKKYILTTTYDNDTMSKFEGRPSMDSVQRSP